MLCSRQWSILPLWCWSRQPKPFALVLLYYSLTELQTAPSAERTAARPQRSLWRLLMMFWKWNHPACRLVKCAPSRVDYLLHLFSSLSLVFSPLSFHGVYLVRPRRKRGARKKGRQRGKKKETHWELHFWQQKRLFQTLPAHIVFFYFISYFHWTQHSGDH